MLRAHSFNAGSRYSDYVPGDKTAAYTIAGLVATVAGAKVIKAVAGVSLLLLLKKFGIFVVAAFAAVLSKLKNLFRSKSGAGSRPSSV
jgi:uncharacterized membrane-anchored protein